MVASFLVRQKRDKMPMQTNGQIWLQPWTSELLETGFGTTAGTSTLVCSHPSSGLAIWQSKCIIIQFINNFKSYPSHYLFLTCLEWKKVVCRTSDFVWLLSSATSQPQSKQNNRHKTFRATIAFLSLQQEQLWQLLSLKWCVHCASLAWRKLAGRCTL